jgi:hypothetical protein
MNFDERKKIARELLTEFLGGFSAPRGLSDEGQAKTIYSISDAFARRMPISGQSEYEQAIIKVFEKVLDNHTTYAWPPQGIIVDAMPQAESKSFGAAPESFKGNDEMVAKAMNEGDGVPERAVWGSLAKRLVHSGAVSRDVMDKYRMGSVESFRGVYRDEAAKIMEAKHGFQVREYWGATQ